MFLKRLVIFLGLIFWPLSYLLTNGLQHPNSTQTIFKIDHDKRQEIIRLSQLYPNITLARVFQNKYKIVLDKYKENVFYLIDPNNYLFESAPRQGVAISQGLNKYPFMAIIFFGYAFVNFNKVKKHKLLGISLICLILLLSLLEVVDRWDFILWIPLSIIFVNGVRLFFENKRKIALPISLVFLVFSTIELIRIFIR